MIFLYALIFSLASTCMMAGFEFHARRFAWAGMFVGLSIYTAVSIVGEVA